MAATPRTTSYTVWCIERAVSHAHCPLWCDHPQPFTTVTGDLLCGSCWHVYGRITIMDPCYPETCRDA